jgi:hypothetical protein
MKQRAFEKHGRFLKGNLHTHTELSDGRRPPAEVAGIYRDLGYDFLAITDHNRLFKSGEFNEEIYILPGLEIHSTEPDSEHTHHVVALTTYDNDKVSHGQVFENAPWIDAGTSCDNICRMMEPLGFDMIYCHSIWSRSEPDEFRNPGFMAMEVYNGVCEYNYDQGIQEAHWDNILRGGLGFWGVATDDCHGRDIHYGRGYVMVKAEKTDDRSILESLKEGAFYASRGPEIYDFGIKDGKVYVKCSPAAMITFITYESRGFSFKFNEPETEAEMVFSPDIDYVRAEVTDANGMKAWTNPIFLK